jgi:excisionase family DNA binding protein
MGITTPNRKGIEESTPQGLLTPEQVAAYLGCGRTYAYKMLQTGEIPSLKIGRLRRVRLEDVFEYVRKQLDEQESNPATAASRSNSL